MHRSMHHDEYMFYNKLFSCYRFSEIKFHKEIYKFFGCGQKKRDPQKNIRKIPSMRKFVYSFRAVFLGLIIAQVLSTLSVYSSNTELFRSTQALLEAGYLAVPNSNTVNTLTTFGAAFFGGMFFTFSIGAGLSLLSFYVEYIWDRFFARNEYFLIPFLIFWLWCIISVNDKGICRIPTAYFLFIPTAVFAASVLLPHETSEDTRLKLATHFICLTALTIIASSQMNTDIFLKIRDNLLLSNPAGMKLNDFYYRYTLYAAQVFKSQNQKLIKTCRLSLIDDPLLLQQMKKHLLNNDYLVLDKDDPDITADLEIIKIQDTLDFKIKVWTILQTSPREFLQYPQDTLKQFSANSDKHAFFRAFTFYSLSAVVLLLFYLTAYSLCQGICRIFIKTAGRFINPANAGFTQNQETEVVSAGILCLIMGAIVFISLGIGNKDYRDSDELSVMLASENWRQRVTALRYIAKNNIDIGSFPGYVRLLDSPYVPDRYWLARAMSRSRSPEIYEGLTRLLEDSNFNVVYSAIYALGEHGNKEAVPKILREIAASDNWYVQLYAYKALRKLGWTQTKLH